jgi:glycosyltransferase involved in cell wall biosynthesis
MSTPTDQPVELSIVIIARNEEKNITRAIESVLRAVEDRPQTEIVLVDSASTDQTVEIAKQYPISIVRLRAGWVLSAAAGRYTGTRHTKGDFILFLDGDMVLKKAWLDDAVPYMTANPMVAGVTGIVRDVHGQDSQDGSVSPAQMAPLEPERDPIPVKHFGGAAIYRRTALEHVGGFNPYLISEEEPELSIRLRHAGYTLMCLPQEVGLHYCIPSKSLQGHLRRARMNYFLGFGQIPRYYLGTSLFWTYIIERGSYLVCLFGTAFTFVTCLITLLTGNFIVLGTWMVIVGAFLMIYLIKNNC